MKLIPKLCRFALFVIFFDACYIQKTTWYKIMENGEEVLGKDIFSDDTLNIRFAAWTYDTEYEIPIYCTVDLKKSKKLTIDSMFGNIYFMFKDSISSTKYYMRYLEIRKCDLTIDTCYKNKKSTFYNVHDIPKSLKDISKAKECLDYNIYYSMPDFQSIPTKVKSIKIEFEIHYRLDDNLIKKKFIIILQGKKSRHLIIGRDC